MRDTIMASILSTTKSMKSSVETPSPPPTAITLRPALIEDLDNAALQVCNFFRRSYTLTDDYELLEARWYPTSVILLNGSTPVVDGTDTSRAAPQPNSEILPSIPGGDTAVYLDLLAHAHPFDRHSFNRRPFNRHPFNRRPFNHHPLLFILPSSNVFAGKCRAVPCCVACSPTNLGDCFNGARIFGWRW
jgi:hypothetical protein